MIKSELIAKIGRTQDHLSERVVTLCVNSIIKTMMNHLAKGGRIEVRDFGSLDNRFHKPRLAHNPKTGKKLITDPKYVVHFKPGKGMKERINASQDIPIKNHSEDSSTDE